MDPYGGICTQAEPDRLVMRPTWYREATGSRRPRPVLGREDGTTSPASRRKDVSEMTNTETEQFTMYTTPWCGYCKRLKSQLSREGITGREVNIEQDPGAAEYVMKVNGGNATVPTVVFADDTAMTNPSLAQVKQKLAELS